MGASARAIDRLVWIRNLTVLFVFALLANGCSQQETVLDATENGVDVVASQGKAEKRVCPKCGRTYWNAELFCMYDRTQLVEAASLASTEKICPVCGKTYPPSKSFCLKDGATLVDVDEQGGGLVDHGDETHAEGTPEGDAAVADNVAGDRPGEQRAVDEAKLPPRAENKYPATDSDTSGTYVASRDPVSTSTWSGSSGRKTSSSGTSSRDSGTSSSGTKTTHSYVTGGTNTRHTDNDPKTSGSSGASTSGYKTSGRTSTDYGTSGSTGTKTSAYSPPDPTPRPRVYEPPPTPIPQRATPVPPPPPTEPPEKVAIVVPPPDKKPAQPSVETLKSVDDLFSDFEGLSNRAASGKLDPGDVSALESVETSDNKFTRTRALLAMNYKSRDNKKYYKAMSELMSLPENKYNPVYNLELAEYYLLNKQYGKSASQSKMVERYHQRIPKAVYYQTMARMYEVQAKALEGQFNQTEDTQYLDKAIRVWERYKQHVGRKNETERMQMASQYIDKLEKVKRRVE